MKSIYRPIGEYIKLVDERNKGLRVTQLLGLSISKRFISSVANIIGTDMESYKVIRRNQFACSTMQVRRDKKMPVALLQETNEAIISQAYQTFEVKDKTVLLPEYLMMWFSRPEFDREACFHAVGGVRGSLEWEDLENLQMPIPKIDKQREIIKEYNTIQNRIDLNQQLIQKLEETAQAIYREWFVEFEFPDENGKPYKSNGGEMIWNEELGKEIPEGWEVVWVKDFCKEMKSGGTPSRDNINYWNSKDIPWLKTGEVCNRVLTSSEEYISYDGYKNSSAKILPINSVLIAMYGEGKTKGQTGYLRFEATVNQACCAMTCENEFESTFLYYFLRSNQSEIANLANGGAQPNLSKELIEKIRLIKPLSKDISKHCLVKFINYSESLEIQNKNLSKLKDLVLSKMATIKN